ncbi:MAG: hypothetical protein A2X49_05735 [Lentisphaerae bacterium GWF2_52_8]|nr:MAG: hypothetical protein A2X49_05735 [Lentisphaerae bacterium GWF2_52_8]
MAITSWTSEDMDWTDVHGAPYYPFLEAARLATVERLDICAGISGNWPISPSELLVEIAHGKPPWRGVYDIHNYVSFCAHSTSPYVGRYLNHTVSWASGFVNWNSTTMKAALGVSDFEAVPSRNAPPAAVWLKQQYQMLNLCRNIELIGFNYGTVFLHAIYWTANTGNTSAIVINNTESDCSVQVYQVSGGVYSAYGAPFTVNAGASVSSSDLWNTGQSVATPSFNFKDW